VGIISASALTVLAPGAVASEMVDTMTKYEKLSVDKNGTAQVIYKKKGKTFKVLYWGGHNTSLRFKYDRSNGWKSKKHNWKKPMKSVCGKYTGPAIPYAISTCTMPDGSHWALQKWERTIANYGGQYKKKKFETRISHWTGDAAKFEVWDNWSWSGRYTHIFGTLTYLGKPVYAKKFRDDGYVLDGIGRNLTIDAYDSDYGSGWRRVNAILTHRPSGQFCFGFSPKFLADGDQRRGKSSVDRYRLAVAGPFVSPDIEYEFSAKSLSSYTPEEDELYNNMIRQLTAGSFTKHNCRTVN
jgi:hypothetical protein